MTRTCLLRTCQARMRDPPPWTSGNLAELMRNSAGVEISDPEEMWWSSTRLGGVQWRGAQRAVEVVKQKIFDRNLISYR
jgi:hypothetical protein